MKEGQSYTNCGGPGPDRFEYWARAATEPMGEPNCSNGNCSCEACEEARQQALDAIRPDPTTAYQQPIRWNPQNPNNDACQQCNGESCWEASWDRFSGPEGTLPEPEETITWSCNCEKN